KTLPMTITSPKWKSLWIAKETFPTRTGRKVPAIPAGTIPSAPQLPPPRIWNGCLPRIFLYRCWCVLTFRMPPNPSFNELEENITPRSRHLERVKYHSAARPRIRAARHLHHHHTADDE